MCPCVFSDWFPVSLLWGRASPSVPVPDLFVIAWSEDRDHHHALPSPRSFGERTFLCCNLHFGCKWILFYWELHFYTTNTRLYPVLSVSVRFLPRSWWWHCRGRTMWLWMDYSTWHPFFRLLFPLINIPSYLQDSFFMDSLIVLPHPPHIFLSLDVYIISLLYQQYTCAEQIHLFSFYSLFKEFCLVKFV